jgi:hypothetical protein
MHLLINMDIYALLVFIKLFSPTEVGKLFIGETKSRTYSFESVLLRITSQTFFEQISFVGSTWSHDCIVLVKQVVKGFHYKSTQFLLFGTVLSYQSHHRPCSMKFSWFMVLNHEDFGPVLINDSIKIRNFAVCFRYKHASMI